MRLTNKQTESITTAKIKSISLLLIAGLLIYLSIKMLASSLYALQTDLFLTDWQNKANTSQEIAFKPDNQAWLNANQAIENANQTSPVPDAFLQEKIGKVYQWNTYTQPYGDNKTKDQRENVLQAYRKQTEITPKWPQAWLNLINIKIELNKFDQEFYHAFTMAQQTSNQNPEVTPRLTLLGIQAWSNLNKSAKNSVLKMIIHQANLGKKPSQDLKPLLQAYNLLPISCIYAKAIKADTFELCK